MLRVFFLYTMCTLALFSCKKDLNPRKSTDKQTNKKLIKVGVSGFENKVLDLRTSQARVSASDSLKEYISYLYYLVFNASGEEVSRRVQSKTQEQAFGLITDSLVPGSYTVFIMGTPKSLQLNEDHKGINDWPKRPLAATLVRYRQGTAGTPYCPETFIRKLKFNLNKDSVISDITLVRNVGKLEVNISDITTSHKVVVAVNNQPVYYKIDNGDTGPGADGMEVGKTTSSKRFETFVLNTTTPFNVTMKCYDAANNLLKERVISNVRCYPNKKTVMTGKIFEVAYANPNLSFKVNVEDGWEGQDMELPF
jgi:hypothetical protein